MYIDPNGYFAIISFLISVGVSSAISIIMELVEDKKDGECLNDKNIWDYVGAGISGAISGMAGNIAMAILLGGVSSVIDDAFAGELTEKNLMLSFVGGAIGGIIGFGISEIVKFGTSFAEAGIGKMISKVKTNNIANRMFSKMGAANIKIGENSIKEITKVLASAEKNYVAVTISSLASGWF